MSWASCPFCTPGWLSLVAKLQDSKLICSSTCRPIAEMEKQRHKVVVDGTGRQQAGFPEVSGVMSQTRALQVKQLYLLRVDKVRHSAEIRADGVVDSVVQQCEGLNVQSMAGTYASMMHLGATSKQGCTA